MMEILLEPLFRIVFVGIGYVIGFLPVVILSLGTISPGTFDSFDDGGAFYRSKGMKFWHLTYTDNGARFLPVEAVALVGWLLVAMAGFTIWSLIEFLIWRLNL